MKLHYLEIVTSNVEATCAVYARIYGVTFGEPVAGLGHARTAAALASGGEIGVRAPMSEVEQPVVRPYLLVDDIDAALEAVVTGGGEVAHPAMAIPGRGKFAVYILGGIHHGLWQV